MPGAPIAPSAPLSPTVPTASGPAARGSKNSIWPSAAARGSSATASVGSGGIAGNGDSVWIAAHSVCVKCSSTSASFSQAASTSAPTSNAPAVPLIPVENITRAACEWRWRCVRGFATTRADAPPHDVPGLRARRVLERETHAERGAARRADRGGTGACARARARASRGGPGRAGGQGSAPAAGARPRADRHRLRRSGQAPLRRRRVRRSHRAGRPALRQEDRRRALRDAARLHEGLQEGVGRPGQGVHRRAAARGSARRPWSTRSAAAIWSSALVVYPDATELTTISLEAAGDVRVIDTIRQGASSSSDLDEITLRHPPAVPRGALDDQELAGRVALDAARHAHVRARRARGARHGAGRRCATSTSSATATLRYLTERRARRSAPPSSRRRSASKTPPKNVHALLVRAGLGVRERRDPVPAARRRERAAPHVSPHRREPRRSAHGARTIACSATCAQKGKVAVMTKAASFLLWYDDFTQIRDYLLEEHRVDDLRRVGHPAELRRPRRLRADHVRRVHRPVLRDRRQEHARASSSSCGRTSRTATLPFRFGYPDAAKHNHLMITRPKAS